MYGLLLIVEIRHPGNMSDSTLRYGGKRNCASLSATSRWTGPLPVSRNQITLADRTIPLADRLAPAGCWRFCSNSA